MALLMASLSAQPTADGDAVSKQPEATNTKLTFGMRAPASRSPVSASLTFSRCNFNLETKMKNTCNSSSFNVGDRVIFTDDDGAEHLATVLRIDGTLLLAFDDGEEGWESATACRHLCGYCSGLEPFRPGAVFWGCTCGVSDAEFNALYSFWTD